MQLVGKNSSGDIQPFSCFPDYLWGHLQFGRLFDLVLPQSNLARLMLLNLSDGF
jgi:hypothetical protein